MPSTIIDLTGFAQNDGFVIQGEADYDGAGGSVSNAGDINGDGIDDLIVLAVGGDDGGNNAGQVYVVYGRSGASRGRVDLATLAASDGFVIQGDVADFRLGLVSAAGDVNGDGIDDLIIGARYGDDGAINGGQAYVVYGRSGTARGRVDLANLATNDGFVILGKDQNDYAGYSVSGGGDINGDGIDDLIVGAPRNRDGGVGAGAVYVVYGKAGATRTQVDLATLAAADGFAILGDSLNGSFAGARVADAGDVNGDGIDDLMLLSQNSGKIYVVFGNTGATRPTVNLFGLAASDGYVIQGDVARDFAFGAIAGAGDINGDGIDDLLLGASLNGDVGTTAGKVYVIYGTRDPARSYVDLDLLTAGDGFSILGDAAYDRLGNSLSAAGDVNGDGIGDVIVGSGGNDRGGVDAGASYVVFGRAGATRGTLDLTGLSSDDGFVIQGDSTYDGAGTVSGGGDINGDGIDDLIIGASGGDDGGPGAGEAYVIYGRLVAGAIAGADTGDLLTGTTAADAIYGLAGDDVVFGAGGDDRLFGADGSDGLFGEAGNDTLSGGGGQDKVDGGADNDIVNGGAEGDSLRGGEGDDVLDGGAGSDSMNGGTGVDIFTGGEGRDKFRFGDGDTGNTIATADRITDLDQAQGERISLTLVDAIVGGADDSFTFIGTAVFGNVAGQLRYELIGGNTYVMGDTNGDGASDFMIRLDGALVLTGADFSL